MTMFVYFILFYLLISQHGLQNLLLVGIYFFPSIIENQNQKPVIEHA